MTGTAPDTLDPGDVARGGAFFPAIGLLLGGVIAATLLALEPLVPRAAVAVAGVALLWAASRGTLPRAFARLAGRVTLGGLLLAKAAALATLDGGVLAFALVLSATAGRWAYVVQAYGSLPAPDDPLAAALVRKLEFNEFAVASVTAMAATLVLSNALGVLLLVAVATVTIGLRVAVHRRLGGVSSTSLAAGAELAEAVGLVTCALLVALVRTLDA